MRVSCFGVILALKPFSVFAGALLSTPTKEAFALDDASVLLSIQKKAYESSSPNLWPWVDSEVISGTLDKVGIPKTPFTEDELEKRPVKIIMLDFEGRRLSWGEARSIFADEVHRKAVYQILLTRAKEIANKLGTVPCLILTEMEIGGRFFVEHNGLKINLFQFHNAYVQVEATQYAKTLQPMIVPPLAEHVPKEEDCPICIEPLVEQAVAQCLCAKSHYFHAICLANVILMQNIRGEKGSPYCPYCFSEIGVEREFVQEGGQRMYKPPTYLDEVAFVKSKGYYNKAYEQSISGWQDLPHHRK